MDEQGQNDELYPIAVLIDELKVRVSALLGTASPVVLDNVNAIASTTMSCYD